MRLSDSITLARILPDVPARFFMKGRNKLKVAVGRIDDYDSTVHAGRCSADIIGTGGVIEERFFGDTPLEAFRQLRDWYFNYKTSRTW